jgi:hypothetical protein
MLAKELDPNSGLNDKTELAIIRRIVSEIRDNPGKLELSDTEANWLKEYLSSELQDW